MKKDSYENMLKQLPPNIIYASSGSNICIFSDQNKFLNSRLARIKPPNIVKDANAKGPKVLDTTMSLPSPAMKRNSEDDI